MHGERLKGKFALIRMKPRGKGKPQWLLMKLEGRVRRGRERGSPEARGEAQGRRQEAAPARASRNGKAPKTVELTHPDRVIYPEAGLTKADVFAYYEKVADRLLPFLKDRPITLERLPEGLAERPPHFWQKDTPDYYPDWIPRIELETERGKPVHYALVNDEATLLYLVNQGTLTFHVWASRIEDLDRPDFVLFDLDPGKATFADVDRGGEGDQGDAGRGGRRVVREDLGQDGPARPHPVDAGRRITTRRGPGRWSSPSARPRRCPSRRPSTSARRSGATGSTSTSCRTPAATTPSRPTSCGRSPARRSRRRWTGRRSPRGSTPGAFTLKKALARLARRKTDPFEGLLKSFAGRRRKKAAKG